MPTIIFHLIPLQQIAVPPPAHLITASSGGVFTVNWFKFHEHVRRTHEDNHSSDMICIVKICCRNPGDEDWTEFYVKRGVLLSGSVDFREEILARPDDRPIFIRKMPVKVMLQLLIYLHYGTLIAPLEEMDRFMLAKHQLRIGAVYENSYFFQLIRILNPRTELSLTLSLHSPWLSDEFLPPGLCDDLKENTNCATECISGQCVHRRRLRNPSIRIRLANSLKMTRSELEENEQVIVAPQASPPSRVAIEHAGRVQAVALDHGYCRANVTDAVDTRHMCYFCGRRFVNNDDFRQHQSNITFYEFKNFL